MSAPTRSISRTLALIGTTLVAAPALGQERATHELVWERGQGAEACPDSATFTDSIRTRVGYDPFQQGSRRQLQIRLSRAAEKWHAELRALDNGLERGSQRLEAQGPDCSALFAAIVAVASVTLDEASTLAADPSAQVSPAESKPEQTKPEPPPPAVVPNHAPPGASRERPRPRSSGQSSPAKRWALGFELGQDLQLIEDKKEICGYGETESLMCFEHDSPFVGAPMPRVNNRVAGGTLYGNPRLLGDVQYLLTSRLALELRLGWAFGGGPQAANGSRFLPLHFEGGVRFWLADQRSRLRGYLGTSLGIANFDARIPVSVKDCGPRARGVVIDGGECPQGGEGTSKTLDVYQRLGVLFVSGRVGLAWRFADDHAWSVGLATAYAFPNTGIIFAPNIGYSALF